MERPSDVSIENEGTQASDLRFKCGAKENRTPDLVIANDALYQLSYSPKCIRESSAALPK